jgi:ABC-type multidrug transport system ATPase subunit
MNTIKDYQEQIFERLMEDENFLSNLSVKQNLKFIEDLSKIQSISDGSALIKKYAKLEKK